MSDVKHTLGSNNGTISRAEILRHIRFELRDSRTHGGNGPRRITLGLHFAESIIHHLREDESAPELLAALKRIEDCDSIGAAIVIAATAIARAEGRS